MLIEEDLALIGRDKRIPGLSLLLNADELRKQILAETGLHDPGEFKADYLRYKPGQSCIARYRFQAAGKDQFAYAKAFSVDARLKLEKARDQDSHAGSLGPGRVILEQDKIQFSVFPNDLKLRSIGKLEQVQTRQNLLARLFKSRSGWNTATLQHLNYKPERRYVARCTSESGETAVVKFYSGTEFSRVREVQKALKSGYQVRLPELIGGSKAHRALAFSWVPGSMLRQHIELLQLNEVEAAGAAIAQFHLHPQPGLKTRSQGILAAQLGALAQDLGMVLPEVASLSSQLAKSMGQWWLSQDDPALPIHGDFYDKQLIVEGESASLIDTDDAHLGHPLRDIACFIAHLERKALNHQMDFKDVGTVSHALTSGYARINPALRVEPLGKLTAISLFQQAHHPFRDRVPDWPEKIRALVNRSAALFGDPA